jgi:hypothetical protein
MLTMRYNFKVDLTIFEKLSYYEMLIFKRIKPIFTPNESLLLV